MGGGGQQYFKILLLNVKKGMSIVHCTLYQNVKHKTRDTLYSYLKGKVQSKGHPVKLPER